ncbi:MAG: SGNH/GDSL hydrolase family protein [Candidatus Obscuribacterales bacterium]|nr:SGNH/GDSL hydrolase family protein [Candidatus Obscuribacterales bacterium]
MKTLERIKTSSRPESKPSKRVNLIRPLIQPFFVLLVSILLLEGIFTVARIGERDYLEPDPVTGVALIPNKRITYRGENYSSRLINKYGMAWREPSLKKASGLFRIAVLGDSMIEGAQVEECQTMCHFLEQNLNANGSGQKFEVLNFGVPSFTLGQAYLLLKEKALSFQPDLVLIFVRDHASYGVTPPHLESGFPLGARPYFFVAANGALYKSNAYLMQWWRGQEAKRLRNLGWLRRHSHIWGALGAIVEQSMNWFMQTRANFDQFLSKACLNFSPKMIADKAPAPKAPSANPPASSDPSALPGEQRTTQCVRQYFPVVAAILREMNRSCDQKESKFAMIYIGSKDEAGLAEYDLMKSFASDKSIQLLDLTESFDKAQSHSTAPLFLSDAHFTPSGHEVFAKLIANDLRQWKWFQDRPKTLTDPR